MNKVKQLTTRHAVLLALLLLLLGGCTQDTGDVPTPSPEQESAAIDLVGTAWQLDYIGELESERVAIEGSRSTLNFLVVNYLGSGGCNWFQGVYKTEGSSLTLGPPFQTQLTCSEPDGILDQEGLFFGALVSATNYGLDGDQLVLYREGDQRLMTFSPAEDVDFEDTNWGLKLINNGNEWFAVTADSEITAQFVDGALAGNAGCNDYDAVYLVDGDALTIADLTATEEACDVATEVMNQESVYLANLEAVAGYDVIGGMLILLDEAGNPVLLYGTQ